LSLPLFAERINPLWYTVDETTLHLFVLWLQLVVYTLALTRELKEWWVKQPKGG
jgi:hypothetical protein